MPRVKDITGDLGRLRQHKVMPTGEAPVLRQAARLERRLAHDGTAVFFWTLIACFLVLQVVFLVWLSR